MTLQQLLDKYPDTVQSDMPQFKPEYIFDSGPWLADTGIPIFAECHDGRRGIWINKFVNGSGELACVQINAGREGDDACATICLDKQWLMDMAEKYNTTISISEYGSVEYASNTSIDITKYVTDEVSTYGTSHEATTPLINTILELT